MAPSCSTVVKPTAGLVAATLGSSRVMIELPALLRYVGQDGLGQVVGDACPGFVTDARDGGAERFGKSRGECGYPANCPTGIEAHRPGGSGPVPNRMALEELVVVSQLHGEPGALRADRIWHPRCRVVDGGEGGVLSCENHSEILGMSVGGADEPVVGQRVEEAQVIPGLGRITEQPGDIAWSRSAVILILVARPDAECLAQVLGVDPVSAETVETFDHERLPARRTIGARSWPLVFRQWLPLPGTGAR